MPYKLEELVDRSRPVGKLKTFPCGGSAQAYEMVPSTMEDLSYRAMQNSLREITVIFEVKHNDGKITYHALEKSKLKDIPGGDPTSKAA